MFNLQNMSIEELENLKRIADKAESYYDHLASTGMPEQAGYMYDRAEETGRLWLEIVLEIRGRKGEQLQ